MNTEQFLKAYGESRNGTERFTRHPLVRAFVYSDGVRECAEAGCYWLLDVLATELPNQWTRGEPLCIVTVSVKKGKASITGEFRDGDPNPYRKRIRYTDMPEGEWKFLVGNDGDGLLRCFLLTEY